jgi:dienelactone hydrolase
LYGASRGAEGALLIASYQPHLFDAVVADSPSAFVNPAFGGKRGAAAWTLHGRPLKGGMNIPVTDIRVPLLLGDGGQDAVWDSAGSATEIMQELRFSPDHARYANLFYPGAGHAYFGLPPYLPYAAQFGTGQPFGGTQQANALASEQFWTQMIKFLDSSRRGAA